MQELQRVLNLPQNGWICLKRTWIYLNMTEYMSIYRVLNMSYTIDSARLLYKLMINYGEMGMLRTLSKIIVSNYFCKNTSSWIFERFLNMCRILNMSGFWIFQDHQYARVLNFQDYIGFTYIHIYDRGLSMYALGCNYRRVMNIPGFRICQVSAYARVTQGSEYAWIWLNNA